MPVISKDTSKELVGGIASILIGKLLEQLPGLIDKLVDKMDGDDDKVSTNPTITPETDEDKVTSTPTPVEARRVAALEAKLFWVTRKHTPYAKGGGRRLLPDPERDRIRSLEDPTQAGDRCCIDVTPIDQFGKPYVNEKPAVLLHIVSGVGETQVQEENDHTPVVFIPWENEAVRPGFEGEVTYQAQLANGIVSNVVRIRVKPWAA